jgi:DNA-binding MarR family transcriptional regulator
MAKLHRELGNVEARILGQLYDKPDQLIQWVQKALGKDYKTVHEAVKRLAVKGYLESARTEVTERGNTERTYRLSEKGLAYVLAYGLRNFTKIREPYIETEFIKPLMVIHEAVGEKAFDRVLVKGFKLYLTMLEKDEPVTSESMMEYFVSSLGAWTVMHVDDLHKVMTVNYGKVPNKEEVQNNFKVLLQALELEKKKYYKAH